MATDDDDWRARRDAALAGTPFARPREPARDRTDDTLPIDRSEARVSTRAATTSAAAVPPGAAPNLSAKPGASRSLTWLIAGVFAVIAALVWLTGRDRSTVVPPAAPVAVRAAPLRTAAAPVVAPSRPAAPVAAVVSAPPAVSTSPPFEVAPDDPTIVSIPTPRPKSEGKLSSPTTTEATVRAPVRRKPAPSAQSRRATPAPGDSEMPVITLSAYRCSASATRAERAVCASPSLNAKAREERRLYDDVFTDGDARAVAKAQKAHLGLIKRRDRCTTDACMGTAYDRQIATLQKMHMKAAQVRARAAEKLLPPCTKSQRPAPGVCRAGFSLKRLLGL